LSSLGDLSFCLCFGFQSLIGVSLCSFLFFSFLSGYYMCVVNALINGEIEDHVWFEDQWMFASWCDVIAGVGCSLTDVGAGEEQARKVVASEASRCGEDKRKTNFAFARAERSVRRPTDQGSGLPPRARGMLLNY
jgi:hypothetical protein